MRAERTRLASIAMRSSTQRPLLLVDVDGVISLFGFAAAPPAGLLATAVDGIPHLLSDRAGPLLIRLAGTFECVWCTGWEDRAEEHLPRLLGLPGGWPHLQFAPVEAGAARHWKLDAIEARAGRDRPVAWIDDALRRHLRGLGGGPSRAHAAGADGAGQRPHAGARRAPGVVGGGSAQGSMRPRRIA